MKKQITLLLLLFTQVVYGQVTLEHTYPNTLDNAPKCLMYTKLDSVTPKYILFDLPSSKFTIYNLNHSVFLTVNIPITYNFGNSSYTIAYVTKSLFDCDPSNIEYVIDFLGTGSPTAYPKHFYVYRTDGTQLASIDSCCFLNYSDGWKYGPLYNEPIINTPLGTKLLLRSLDNSARVYSLCGTLPKSGMQTNQGSDLGNTYQDPTTNISIPYKLPENENSGLIKIYDLMGNELKSYSVDNTFNSITLSHNDLPEGSYYYQLETSKGVTGAKKIILNL